MQPFSTSWRLHENSNLAIFKGEKHFQVHSKQYPDAGIRTHAPPPRNEMDSWIRNPKWFSLPFSHLCCHNKMFMLRHRLVRIGVPKTLQIIRKTEFSYLVPTRTTPLFVKSKSTLKWNFSTFNRGKPVDPYDLLKVD